MTKALLLKILLYIYIYTYILEFSNVDIFTDHLSKVANCLCSKLVVCQAIQKKIVMAVFTKQHDLLK